MSFQLLAGARHAAVQRAKSEFDLGDVGEFHLEVQHPAKTAKDSADNHFKFHAVAHQYGGTELAHAPGGGAPYRGKPDSMSAFTFKRRSDAWRAATALRLNGHKFRSADVLNSKDQIVGKVKPTKLVREGMDSEGPETHRWGEIVADPGTGASRAGSVAAGPPAVAEAFGKGAWRRPNGKFSSVNSKGGGRWIPHVDPSFRKMAEGLGAELRTSGSAGGLRLVFKSQALAETARAALQAAGHKVDQHELPGVLLVSYIAEARQLCEGISDEVDADVMETWRDTAVYWAKGNAAASSLNKVYFTHFHAKPGANPKHLGNLTDLGMHHNEIDGAVVPHDAGGDVYVSYFDNRKDATNHLSALKAYGAKMREGVEGRLDGLLGSCIGSFELEAVTEGDCDEDFARTFDDWDDAVTAAREMAQRLGVEVAIVHDEVDDDDDYCIMTVPQAVDWCGLGDDPGDEHEEGGECEIDAVIRPSDGQFAVDHPLVDKDADDVDEALVAKRRRLAARLNANRVAKRPMSGARRRTAMNAKRWRLRNRGRHHLKMKSKVYRTGPTLKPLQKH